MGTSASSPQKRHATLTDEQKLIKNLGEYFPFSDSELRVLYKCFSEHNTSANKTQGCPFILDLAMFAPTHSTEEEYKTHEHHLKYIFEHVLPPRFSSKLEAVAFRQLLALENNQTEGRTQQRLEAFLEAVTKCCGRRNAHSSLEIIYQCCCYEDSSSATPEPFGLIDLSYRLALTSQVDRNKSRGNIYHDSCQRHNPAIGILLGYEMLHTVQCVCSYSRALRWYCCWKL